VTAAVVAVGCAGGGSEGAPAGERVLVAEPSTIRVGPNEMDLARVVMTSGGVPVGSAPVTFSIGNAPIVPGTTTTGAALLATTATTDASGAAAVAVSVDARVALASVFSVSASAGTAYAEVTVIVADASSGSVVVAPFFPTSDAADRATGGIDLRFYDNRRCADLDPYMPPDVAGARKAPLAASGETAQFDYVTATKPAAALGRATDGFARLVAFGCIDIPESSVVPDGVVEVALPLRDNIPSPVGRFAVTSPLVFVPPLAAAASIAVPWRDLGDCPLDPAQMFLDCMTDALSPAAADDPLDCKPKPGGEGALGDAFAARRGVPIVDAAGAVTACRGSFDAAGKPSLDAIAMGLFGTPTPALLVALPAVGNDAAHVLDAFTLISRLDVQSTGRADEYVVSHTLQNALIKGSGMAEARVELSSLALPALTAVTTATVRDGVLAVDEHGFSLRLGRVARAGFGLATLMPLIPGQKSLDAGGLITEILKLAHSDDGSATGCAAFDGVLCPAVGSAAACLAKACPDGLSALTSKLNGAFDAADGTGLDFTLAGSAPLLDTQGGGFARKLGTDPNDSTSLARWSVDLRTASGRARLLTPFEGVRTN